jgi:hypothetical protein
VITILIVYPVVKVNIANDNRSSTNTITKFFYYGSLYGTSYSTLKTSIFCSGNKYEQLAVHSFYYVSSNSERDILYL